MTTRSGDSPGGPRSQIALRALLVVHALLLFFMTPLPFLVLGWFLETEPGDVSHKVHEISFGALFALSLVGDISQFRSPERKVAPMYQVLIPILLGMAAVAFAEQFDPFIVIFVIPPLLMLAVHPARRELFRPALEPSAVLLLAAAAAAVPLVAFAAGELELAADAAPVAARVESKLPEDASDARFEQELERQAKTPEMRDVVRHAGHWSVMGAFGLSIAALALLAALKPAGWRVAAWSAACAAILYGVASAVFPTDASARPGAWAIAAISWGVVFLLISETEARKGASPAPARL